MAITFCIAHTGVSNERLASALSSEQEKAREKASTLRNFHASKIPSELPPHASPPPADLRVVSSLRMCAIAPSPMAQRFFRSWKVTIVT